jgi:phospholipid-translocating ATPase
MVCHNVTPVYDENGTRDFQASSPDEVALVRFIDNLGHKLVERDENKIIIENVNG